MIGFDKMKKIIKFSLIYLFLFSISQVVLAGDILEPELFEITDAWLTSKPQPVADYHVLRVCEDEDMSEDCTQCIYKAKSDGAVWIPVNNRCIYRVKNDTVYTLYYQIKSSTIDGLHSKWTIPRTVYVNRDIKNLEINSYAFSVINYDTQSYLQEE
jgi:hypothetical protein